MSNIDSRIHPGTHEKIQDMATLDSIVAQIAFWSEFFSKLLNHVRVPHCA